MLVEAEGKEGMILLLGGEKKGSGQGKGQRQRLQPVGGPVVLMGVEGKGERTLRQRLERQPGQGKGSGLGRDGILAKLSSR